MQALPVIRIGWCDGDRQNGPRQSHTSYYEPAGRRGRCFAEIDLMMRRRGWPGSMGWGASSRAWAMRSCTPGSSIMAPLSSLMWRAWLPRAFEKAFGVAEAGAVLQEEEADPAREDGDGE